MLSPPELSPELAVQLAILASTLETGEATQDRGGQEATQDCGGQEATQDSGGGGQEATQDSGGQQATQDAPPQAAEPGQGAMSAQAAMLAPNPKPASKATVKLLPPTDVFKQIAATSTMPAATSMPLKPTPTPSAASAHAVAEWPELAAPVSQVSNAPSQQAQWPELAAPQQQAARPEHVAPAPQEKLPQRTQLAATRMALRFTAPKAPPVPFAEPPPLPETASSTLPAPSSAFQLKAQVKAAPCESRASNTAATLGASTLLARSHSSVERQDLAAPAQQAAWPELAASAQQAEWPELAAPAQQASLSPPPKPGFAKATPSLLPQAQALPAFLAKAPPKATAIQNGHVPSNEQSLLKHPLAARVQQALSNARASKSAASCGTSTLPAGTPAHAFAQPQPQKLTATAQQAECPKLAAQAQQADWPEFAAPAPQAMQPGKSEQEIQEAQLMEAFEAYEQEVQAKQARQAHVNALLGSVHQDACQQVMSLDQDALAMLALQVQMGGGADDAYAQELLAWQAQQAQVDAILGSVQQGACQEVLPTPAQTFAQWPELAAPAQQPGQPELAAPAQQVLPTLAQTFAQWPELAAPAQQLDQPELATPAQQVHASGKRPPLAERVRQALTEARAAKGLMGNSQHQLFAADAATYQAPFAPVPESLPHDQFRVPNHAPQAVMPSPVMPSDWPVLENSLAQAALASVGARQTHLSSEAISGESGMSSRNGPLWPGVEQCAAYSQPGFGAYGEFCSSDRPANGAGLETALRFEEKKLAAAAVGEELSAKFRESADSALALFDDLQTAADETQGGAQPARRKRQRGWDDEIGDAAPVAAFPPHAMAPQGTLAATNAVKKWRPSAKQLDAMSVDMLRRLLEKGGHDLGDASREFMLAKAKEVMLY